MLMEKRTLCDCTKRFKSRTKDCFRVLVAPEIGNAMPLSEIPLGTIISCIELRPGQGAVMARSAGSFAQLMAREGKYAQLSYLQVKLD
jgi:ribosomal protein L2